MNLRSKANGTGERRVKPTESLPYKLKRISGATLERRSNRRVTVICGRGHLKKYSNASSYGLPHTSNRRPFEGMAFPGNGSERTLALGQCPSCGRLTSRISKRHGELNAQMPGSTGTWRVSKPSSAGACG